jgi:hypothetical protein
MSCYISNKQSPQPIADTMECSVCYTEASKCKLVCGHSFCMSCIKEWYLKCGDSEATCPMCRRPIYFRGMRNICDKWDEERHEKKLQETFENCFNEILDDDFYHEMSKKNVNLSEFIMYELYNMEWYFNEYKHLFGDDYEYLEEAILDENDYRVETGKYFFEPIKKLDLISKHRLDRLPYIYTHFV